METFAKYLFRKRTQLALERGVKVTQADMAVECGVSEITYYCWEKGRREPTPDKQAEIKAKLGA